MQKKKHFWEIVVILGIVFILWLLTRSPAQIVQSVPPALRPYLPAQLRLPGPTTPGDPSDYGGLNYSDPGNTFNAGSVNNTVEAPGVSPTGGITGHCGCGAHSVGHTNTLFGSPASQAAFFAQSPNLELPAPGFLGQLSDFSPASYAADSVMRRIETNARPDFVTKSGRPASGGQLEQENNARADAPDPRGANFSGEYALARAREQGIVFQLV